MGLLRVQQQTLRQRIASEYIPARPSSAISVLRAATSFFGADDGASWQSSAVTGAGGFTSVWGSGFGDVFAAERGALLTTRILWTYSAAHARYRDPAYLAMADHAHGDLMLHFHDEEQGGYWWSVSADGSVLRGVDAAEVEALVGE